MDEGGVGASECAGPGVLVGCVPSGFVAAAVVAGAGHGEGVGGGAPGGGVGGGVVDVEVCGA